MWAVSKSWGRTVKVSLIDSWVSGSVQVKAKMFCDWVSRGREKNSSLRFRSKKQEVSEGQVECVRVSYRQDREGPL